MSFILDALKKSEIERQRQSVPGLIDTRLSPKRSRLPVWAAALGILLGVNLLVLTYVLWRKSAPAAQVSRLAQPASTTGTATGTGANPGVSAVPGAGADSGAGAGAGAETAAGAAPPTTQHFSPLDGTAEYAPEIPVAPPARSEPRVSAPVRRADAVPHADAPAAVADTDAEEALPTVSEINLSGSQALPDLHLDVHVYATKPAERFVYINMRKYHEGARMQEGPTVERIRRDGVVLSYQGLRFLLPRQP